MTSNTPVTNRLHVAIFGETNSGKSALYNAILGQERAIVSEISGTTTDPSLKAMELLPFGPIVLIDTAGLNDSTALGEARIRKTKEILDRTNLAVYAVDPSSFDEGEFKSFRQELGKRKIPFLVVFTKEDIRKEGTSLPQLSKNQLSISVYNDASIDRLKEKISSMLSELSNEEASLIDGLADSGDLVMLVVPIDSEAPKGRLILPQVNLIRACLDKSVRCLVTTPETLEKSLEENPSPRLVITDSQAFPYVSSIVPKTVALTSFSILMARQKGDFAEFVQGIEAIKGLKDKDKVLIAESCSHNVTHEDIGRYKIPGVLRKLTGKELEFTFAAGHDFPDPGDFSLVVHCGGCMFTSKEINSRIDKAKAAHVPITNYGMVLACASGILDRCIDI